VPYFLRMFILTSEISKKEADNSTPLTSMLFVYPLQLTKRTLSLLKRILLNAYEQSNEVIVIVQSIKRN
ncbi:hypothetical protein, partial [Streptococcus sp. DD10]|uniref:hypothetical protein n=1 Tax=Streptococcus sp. DD10 TaxID=1777878 RepID=UPI001E5F1D15